MTTPAEPPPVTAEHGPRPAGSPIECFYCHRQIGQRHRPDCVLWTRAVRLRSTITTADDAGRPLTVTFEWGTDVPVSWTEDQIRHRYNESTWCADNLFDLLGVDSGDLCHGLETKTRTEIAAP